MKKTFLAIILIIILAACGEVSNTQPSTEPGENPTNEESTISSTLKVHYIDAGQADATLFQLSDGGKNYTILFDTGDWNRNDVVDYIAAQNISHLDLIVVSHPDADHIGQLADIVSTYKTGEVWLSGNESSSETFQEAIEAVLESGADYHEPRMGESFEIGPLTIDVLYPAEITGKTNEESISLLFTYGDMRFLFTGDAGKKEELEMLKTGIDIQADILQLGHHGSDTSTDPAFLDAVNPSVAIYSAGEDNSYGHPSPEVVSLVRQKGIELYGTDTNGTIIVSTDGEKFSIASAKENPPIAQSGSDMGKNTDDLNGEAANNSCIDINEASLEELQKITHIGPERAMKLIDLRPFNSIEDLEQIDGIGEGRLADIEDEGLACVKN